MATTISTNITVRTGSMVIMAAENMSQPEARHAPTDPDQAFGG